MFKKLENNRPFLKMALEGFAGDGKTYTAALVAIGLHQKIGSKKPVAIFDTEKAAKALTGLFQENEIEAIVIDDQRSLKALNQAIVECENGAADILIIDSITHVWEEYISAFLAQKNRSRLQFEDWGIIKPQWKKEFSNKYVQSNVHIIFTGRAGYEYTDEKNEETGKREIFKSGIKMKAENETAFEPDLLVLMEKEMNLLEREKSIFRIATIIKDRTATIDGKQFKNPSYESFAPAIDRLLDGVAKRSESAAIVDKFEDSEQKRMNDRKERERLVAEIEGLFNLMALGTSAKDKQFKAWILKTLWQITSIDMMDKKRVDEIKTGVLILNSFSEQYLKYATECNESNSQPDGSVVAEMFKTEVAAFAIEF